MNDLEGSWSGMREVFDEIVNKDVKEFNDLFRSKNAPVLNLPKKEDPLNN